MDYIQRLHPKQAARLSSLIGQTVRKLHFGDPLFGDPEITATLTVITDRCCANLAFHWYETDTYADYYAMQASVTDRPENLSEFDAVNGQPAGMNYLEEDFTGTVRDVYLLRKFCMNPYIDGRHENISFDYAAAFVLDDRTLFVYPDCGITAMTRHFVGDEAAFISHLRSDDRFWENDTVQLTRI